MGKFNIEKTYIKGLFLINSKCFEDERGFFQEIYNEKDFKELGINEKFVQDNYSFSKRAVLRGLHFQEKNIQAKIVRVTKGKIYDVVIDLRKNSKTFGKYFGVVLSQVNKKSIYIPKGFAHGFLSLENNTEILYKCSDIYEPKYESGILWNDQTLNIDWKFEEFQIKKEELIISEKDKNLRIFNEKEEYFL